MRNDKGLTMITLVITVIVMFIITAVAINSAVGENGVITKAKEAKITAELSAYKEQLQVFIDEQTVKDPEFDPETLNAATSLLKYNTKSDTEGNITSIIENIDSDYFTSIEVIKGVLYLSTQDKQVSDIAKILGIGVSPFNIVDGVLLSTDGNLLIMDEYGAVTIPGSAESIGSGAFANVEGLKTVIIPGTCKKIGSNAFAYNDTIERVVMEEGVEEIGSNAFGFSNRLQEVKMPSTLKVIGSQAFYSCRKLKEITIPEGVTTINANTFTSCVSLKEVILPSTLKTIGGSGFDGMTGITSIKIPKSVTSIGSNAFSGCNNLENIDLTDNTKYDFADGVLFAKSDSSIVFITNKKLNESSTFEIPEGIKSFTLSLGSKTHITKIVIPKSLTSITFSQGTYLPKSTTSIEVHPDNPVYAVKDKMLYRKDTKELCYCFSKDQVITIIPEVTKLGRVCFAAATNVKEVIIPETVKELGYMAFTNAPAVKIHIPKSVTTIDSMYKYGNYATVTMDPENPVYEIVDRVIYKKATGETPRTLITLTYYISGEFTIPNDVEVIGSMAFHNQTGMTKVNIPNSVKKIVGSFGYCTALKEITIPESVTSIGSGCFGNCKELDKIYLNKKQGEITGAPWGAPKGDRVVVWTK